MQINLRGVNPLMALQSLPEVSSSSHPHSAVSCIAQLPSTSLSPHLSAHHLTLAASLQLRNGHCFEVPR